MRHEKRYSFHDVKVGFPTLSGGSSSVAVSMSHNAQWITLLTYWLPEYDQTIMAGLDHSAMLAVALAEARKGLAEGGIPVGAAIFDSSGKLVSAGHNRRVQHDDPSMHAETDAFRAAGRQRSYRHLVMVTTLAPCWYCSGLVRQFGFGKVVVGESRNFQGGLEWLRSLGVQVMDLDSQECMALLADYIRSNPEVWNEDIGRE